MKMSASSMGECSFASQHWRVQNWLAYLAEKGNTNDMSTRQRGHTNLLTSVNELDTNLLKHLIPQAWLSNKGMFQRLQSLLK
jgi:hypothetical protein